MKLGRIFESIRPKTEKPQSEQQLIVGHPEYPELDRRGIAIQTENLSVTFQNTNQETIEALKAVNLEIPEGQFLSVVGKSGCGKTTLLRTWSGILAENAKTQGHFALNGSRNMVFQKPTLFPWLTVAKNISFGLDHKTFKVKDKNQRRQIVDEQLRIIGMENRANSMPRELSGGETQRVALAQSLACNPDIILMDEPFSSLDEITKESMQAFLLRLREAYPNKTIVFVTHDLREALLLTDRVIVMKQGQIVADQSITFSHPRHPGLKYSPQLNEAAQKLSSLL